MVSWFSRCKQWQKQGIQPPSQTPIPSQLLRDIMYPGFIFILYDNLFLLMQTLKPFMFHLIIDMTWSEHIILFYGFLHYTIHCFSSFSTTLYINWVLLMIPICYISWLIWFYSVLYNFSDCLNVSHIQFWFITIYFRLVWCHMAWTTSILPLYISILSFLYLLLL